MNIYFLSGIGADNRIFNNLQIPGHTLYFIDWIQPGNDSLEEYLRKLSLSINTTEPFILAGVSFGGIIAQEISHMVKAEKVIIISSVKTSSEIPFLHRLAGRLGINKLLKPSSFMHFRKRIHWYFGLETESDRILFDAINKSADKQLLDWSVDKVINWKNKTRMENVIHIHGTKDKVFPSGKVHADFLIEDAGHFMIVNRAGEVTEAINKILNSNL